MTEQEKAFWELWDKLEPLMQKFDTKPTLREMFDYGYSAAEERIIKLLEPLFDKAENAETRRLLTMGIALIKGENQ